MAHLALRDSGLLAALFSRQTFNFGLAAASGFHRNLDLGHGCIHLRLLLRQPLPLLGRLLCQRVDCTLSLGQLDEASLQVRSRQDLWNATVC